MFRHTQSYRAEYSLSLIHICSSSHIDGQEVLSSKVQVRDFILKDTGKTIERLSERHRHRIFQLLSLIHIYFEADAPLSEREQLVLDLLAKEPEQCVTKLEKESGLKNILTVIKSLLDKEALFVKEELRRTYKPVSYTHLPH